MQTNFNITSAQLCNLTGLTRQRVNQLIQSGKLKENEHFIKLAKNFNMYNELALEVLKGKKK